jgi:hypothetical protein
MGRLGFEPRANALKGRCSTAELPTHGPKTGGVYHAGMVASIRTWGVLATMLTGMTCLAASGFASAQTDNGDARAQARADQRRQQRRTNYRSYFVDQPSTASDFSDAQEITDLRRSARNKLWIPNELENQGDWLFRWSMNGVNPWERWQSLYKDVRSTDAPLSNVGWDMSLENRLTTVRGEKRTSAELHPVRAVIGGAALKNSNAPNTSPKK